MKPFNTFAEMNWLDQIAHLGAGYLLTLLCLVFLPWWAAVMVAVAVAVVREIFQRFVKHPEPTAGENMGARLWRRVEQCGPGCRTDLLFWTLGALMVPLVLFVGAMAP